ncbi:MAG TPA: ricin-type beta-trefoil lectin domain protein [Dongiaceae bacterium]|nr:ricin-type beta-trefoil lectin domain protein [Dongiaceae bacterium]
MLKQFWLLRRCRLLKQYRIPAVLAAVFFTLQATTATAEQPAALDQHTASPQHKALIVQQKLAQSLPLGKTSLLTTHNSYNARYYANLFRYWDPNHVLSVATQLDLGIRAIEYDVHYALDASGRRTLKLCHGTDQHLVCSLYDRSFRDGLLELGTWLRRAENRDELVLLYIEDHMNGRYDLALAELENVVGDLVYRPSGCKPLPMDLRPSDLTRAGKQILIIGGEHCDHIGWNRMVFHYGFPTDNDSFQPFPACRTDRFDTAFIQSNLTRLYEDRTLLTATFGQPSQFITPAFMSDAMACGISNIGMDKLILQDPRLQAALWSWDGALPESNQDCVVLDENHRFAGNDCQGNLAAACKHVTEDEWRITTAAVAVSDAAAQCRSEWGAAFRFDVPRNGYQNTQLKQSLLDRSDAVWLNLHRDTDGEFIADYSEPVQVLPDATAEQGQLRNGQGFCLQVKGDLAEGATLQQRRCVADSSQRWARLADGRLQSGADVRQCIGAETGELKPFGRLQLVNCASPQALRWRHGNNLSLRVEGDDSLALHVAFSTLGPNMPVVLGKFSAHPAQAWMWVRE